MAELLFLSHARWRTITLTKGTARKSPWVLELECTPGLALLPLAEAVARATVYAIAGPSAPVPMDAAHTGNGRNRLEFRLGNEALAELAARRLEEIPQEWTYNRDRLNEDDIDALACDPIVSGIGELERWAREALLLQQREERGDG
ncbi:hypothetical protein [Synechococcus sp. LA31]|uniref:hypothetical protein n=1 Tax=Synechococcus sp. LA31 TaxID=2741953 RepID=UPI001BDD209E|nr:hypothetical protein [Synechococcus sp. LA31]QVV66532.1 hypothetical protein KJJ24_08330 [Synechococcus sp. LA31]